MTSDLSPLVVSIKTSLVSTVITFFLGIFAAYFISHKKRKYNGILDALFTMPMVLPPTVLGFFLLLIFGINSPIGKLLNLINIKVIFSWPATVIAATVVSFPLMYKTTRGAFEIIDSNILDAARTLGVSEWRIFWTITLPLAWPGVASGAILSFARALGEFGATLMIAGNIPGKTQTIPLAIYFAVESGNIVKASVWVISITAISFIVIILTDLWGNYEKRLISRGGKA